MRVNRSSKFVDFLCLHNLTYSFIQAEIHVLYRKAIALMNVLFLNMRQNIFINLLRILISSRLFFIRNILPFVGISLTRRMCVHSHRRQALRYSWSRNLMNKLVMVWLRKFSLVRRLAQPPYQNNDDVRYTHHWMVAYQQIFGNSVPTLVCQSMTLHSLTTPPYWNINILLYFKLN